MSSTRSRAVAKSAAPTHRNRPRADRHNLAQDAIDLSAAAGLVLDAWQQEVLRDALAENGPERWAASEVGVIVPRQNGKGAILEARELAGLFLFNERMIIHSAQLFSTAIEGFRRITSLIEGNPDFRRKVAKISYSHGSEGIELKNGARLRFVARSRSSMRGFTGDCIIMDEAYDLSEEAMAAMLPTLATRPNAQIWYTSSAPLPDSAVLKRLCLRGRAGGDPGLAYSEWCAAYGSDPEDRAAWAQANPSFGIRLTEEFTERERLALHPDAFARERLGIWSEQERSSALPNWSALADPSSSLPDRAPLMFALDVSPARNVSTIAVAGNRADGLRHVEIVDSRPETGWVVERFRQLRERWGPLSVVVDSRGAAGSLVDPLREVAGLTVHTTAAGDIAVASGRFHDACSPATSSLRHLNDPVLNAAVDAAVTRPLGDAWAWDRRKPSADITPLVAVSLASWGLDHFGGSDLVSQIF